MEKHAKESDKATFICINIAGSQEAAGRFAEKHSLQTVTHLVGEPPADYGLAYIPHHVIIGNDGVVRMNYDTPNTDYMKILASL